MRQIGVGLVSVFCVGLAGCTINEADNGYVDFNPGNRGYYTPGYTGYSYNVTYGENPIYDAGYGPVFWNPRNYVYPGQGAIGARNSGMVNYFWSRRVLRSY